MDRTVRKTAATAISLLGVVVFGAGWMQKRKGERPCRTSPGRFINRSPVGYSNVVEVRGDARLHRRTSRS